ncbi:MAG: GtrA family protein [Blautia sp.]|nr:GtrA family protein [Blautia sp.]MCM1200970.1 GtrA family protein [Bacteroides fragilis]
MENFFLWINKITGKMLQFVKFGVVGVSNTLIYYIVYLILYLMAVNYIISSVIGFVISVINAFYWNNKYVFKTNETENRNLLQAFCKTIIAYAGIGLILNNILLILWVEIIGISGTIAPVINLLITTPLNFVLNKFWTFKKEK